MTRPTKNTIKNILDNPELTAQDADIFFKDIVKKNRVNKHTYLSEPTKTQLYEQEQQQLIIARGIAISILVTTLAVLGLIGFFILLTN